MPLTDVEIEMVKTVVGRFFNMKEPTPRTLLIKRFKDPDAVDHLVQSAVLRRHGSEEHLWPMALAFEYCGDADIQRLAKSSLEIVIHVLQNLFEVEMEKTDFTPADVEAHARKLYDIIEPETVNLGLYLAQEFGGVFARFGRNPQGEFTSLGIHERIVTLRNITNIWDEHIRQYSTYLKQKEVPEMENHATRKPLGEQLLILISHSRDRK